VALNIWPARVYVEAIVSPQRVSADVNGGPSTAHRVGHDIKRVGQPKDKVEDGLPGDLPRMFLPKPSVATGIVPDIVDRRLFTNSSVVTLKGTGRLNDVGYLGMA